MRLKKEGQRQGQEQEQQELQQRQRRLDPIIYRVTTGSLSYTEMEIDAAKASPSFEREPRVNRQCLPHQRHRDSDIEGQKAE
jgi:hypothetical protein